MDKNIIDIGFKPHSKKTILVVDDEPSLQAVIFDTLSDDYHILSAHNAKDGIRTAEEKIPDIILMDVMMPDMTGYEAVKVLNANPVTRHIPVIVITARNFDQATVNTIKVEGNVAAFVGKPFKPKDLRDQIARALQKKN